MTMLDRMRQHKNWLKWSLGVVVLAFVGFYIPDFLTSAPGAAPTDIVASVEGREITSADFRRIYFQQVQSYQLAYGGELNDQLLRQLGFDRQILQRMIDEEAAVIEAERLDLNVSDVEVTERILSLPGLQDNAAFIGEEQYRLLLRSQSPPMTPAQFEEDIRRSILLDKLRSAVAAWIEVSDNELREQYRLRNEKVMLDIVTFSPAEFRDGITVTNEELAAQLETNAANYRMPEKRKINYLSIDAEVLRPNILVTDADSAQYYTDNQSQYSTPEQVRASHILFETEGEDEEQVRTRAEAVLADARAGADFATLAEAHSEDAGSASLGGDLDYFSRGRMVPEFESAAFSMEPGAISDLVQTEYGFHIILATDKREASTRPLDEVREQIAEQLQWDRAQAQADLMAEQLAGEMATPEDLARVASEQGLTITESNYFARTDAIEGLGLASGVASAAFSFNPGEVGGPLRTPTGHVFLTVTDEQESYAPELDEVFDRVKTDVLDLRAREAAEQRAAEVTPTLQSADNFTQAAERADLAVTTTDLVARGTAPTGLLSHPTIEEIAFSLAVGETSDVLATDDAVAVIHVAEREDTTEDGFSEAVDSLRSELLMDRQGRFFSAYMTKAKETMRIDINLETLAMSII
ncbi:MAG: peptidyl-prolyl cis-trans isomerase [Vicinamibacterales bacterium]|nr:peptidyl-prolyl cis-trans isomerase [Vicinamibacterales bacterium]